MEWEICMEEYDSELKLPKILSQWGHTFWDKCNFVSRPYWFSLVVFLKCGNMGRLLLYLNISP